MILEKKLMKNQFINPESEKLFVASIDIGTNSTHLLIASIHSENKSFSIKYDYAHAKQLINVPL